MYCLFSPPWWCRGWNKWVSLTDARTPYTQKRGSALFFEIMIDAAEKQKEKRKNSQCTIISVPTRNILNSEARLGMVISSTWVSPTPRHIAAHRWLHYFACGISQSGTLGVACKLKREGSPEIRTFHMAPFDLPVYNTKTADPLEGSLTSSSLVFLRMETWSMSPYASRASRGLNQRLLRHSQYITLTVNSSWMRIRCGYISLRRFRTLLLSPWSLAILIKGYWIATRLLDI